jgi:hypothetical protein
MYKLLDSGLSSNDTASCKGIIYSNKRGTAINSGLNGQRELYKGIRIFYV